MKIFAILVIIIVLLALAVLPFRQTDKSATVTIRGQTFTVELAVTNDSHARGLSNRESLDENSGMLFVFETPIVTAFWMKDMQFPIDIIFINNNRIVTVYENAASPTPSDSLVDLPRFMPKMPVTHVLEINAGLVKKYGFQAGDTVKITNP